MKSHSISMALCLLAVSASLSAPAAFADNFTVSYLAPGVQTPVTGSYETFGTGNATGDTSQTYVSPVTGTYTGTYQLQTADIYGGAGGSDLYLKVYGSDSATLNIGSSVNFFGLWFSALDAGNHLTFFDGATEVYSFDASQFIAGVGDCGGPNPYCGNPNNGGDPGEQFAYINFLDTNGTFDSVVLSQDPGNGAFESDNHTIGANVTTAPGTLLNPVPEPSSLVLLGTGITALTSAVRRRMR